MRLYPDVIAVKAFALEDVAWFEVDIFVGAGADGLEVGRSFARIAALVVGEMMLRYDHSGNADERCCPKW